MRNSELGGSGLVEWDTTEKQKLFKIMKLFGAESQSHQGWKGSSCNHLVQTPVQAGSDRPGCPGPCLRKCKAKACSWCGVKDVEGTSIQKKERTLDKITEVSFS